MGKTRKPSNATGKLRGGKVDRCIPNAMQKKYRTPSSAPLGFNHKNGATHVFASNSFSSQRVKAAAVASREKPMSYSAKFQVHKRATKKLNKLKQQLCHVSIPGNEIKKYERAQLKNSYYFVDGGGKFNPPINPSIPLPEDGSNPKPSHIISIRNGDMHTPNDHLADTSKGLTIFGDGATPFVVPPRDITLAKTGQLENSKPTALCKAIDEVDANTNHKGAERGSSKFVVRDDNHPKYLCPGVACRRGAKGVEQNHYSLKNISDKSSKLLMKLFSQAEHLFRMFIDTESIRVIQEAMNLIDPKTFTTPQSKTSAKIYGSFASGINVYLNAHPDADFTYCCSVVHMKEEYKLEQRVVAYFCFPRLGIAVPLRPGEMIFFNPSEEHCISSRVDNNDTIYCVSLYIKSNVFGLNDNGLPLLPKEARYCQSYNTK